MRKLEREIEEKASTLKPKTRTIVIPIEKLVVCPHNPRKRDLDLDELVTSIKRDGIKEVIEVHPHGDIWHILAGQRRFLAAKKAGKTEVECLEYQIDEEGAEDWCIHDAFHKKEYHPLDLADLVTKIVEKYGSISKASKATGISESKLKKYYGMKGLGKEVRDIIGSPGTKTPPVEIIRKIAQLPELKQVEAFEAVKGKTRSQADKILNRMKSKVVIDRIDKKELEKTEVILIEVSKTVYENLKANAKKSKTSLENYCRGILEKLVPREPIFGGNRDGDVAFSDTNQT